MTLVQRLNAGCESYLLVAISGVDSKVVVYDGGVVIRVTGDEGDLDCGGEKARVCGDVEGVQSGVLDSDLGFGWAGGQQDDEDDSGEDWDGDGESYEGATEKLLVLEAVLPTVLDHCRLGEVRERF